MIDIYTQNYNHSICVLIIIQTIKGVIKIQIYEINLEWGYWIWTSKHTY